MLTRPDRSLLFAAVRGGHGPGVPRRALRVLKTHAKGSEEAEQTRISRRRLAQGGMLSGRLVRVSSGLQLDHYLRGMFDPL